MDHLLPLIQNVAALALALYARNGEHCDPDLMTLAFAVTRVEVATRYENGTWRYFVRVLDMEHSGDDFMVAWAGHTNPERALELCRDTLLMRLDVTREPVPPAEIEEEHAQNA